MLPFTSNNFILFFLVASAQSSTHYRYPVLHEVRWGADLQSIITRKLINETHGNNIFILSCCYLGVTQIEFSSSLVLIQSCNRLQSPVIPDFPKIPKLGYVGNYDFCGGLYKLNSEKFVLNDVSSSSDLTVPTLSVQLVLYHYQHFWFL